MEAEGKCNKMASDTEVHMKKRHGTAFLHAEKMVPIDIHRHLLSVFGDKIVDVSTVRWLVLCFLFMLCGAQNYKQYSR